MVTLDWGQVTPEAANIAKNEFVYVYNHDLSSPDKIDRTIRFIVGRLNYYDTQLPKNPIHLIKIDARGQQINDLTCDYIKKTLLNKYIRPDFITIEIIK
ncbi:MAG TPA: hypothetical protein VIS75_06660 [Chitinophagaceae bacterium]